MQTFLPYDDIVNSVSALDNKRLGKQRVEAFQILKALSDPTYGWRNHPAVKMWRGYEECLKHYLLCSIHAWLGRGFKNTMALPQPRYPLVYPPWLGDPAFHASHRSNLLRKDPVYYGKFGWSEPSDLPYVWPVSGSAR